MSTLLWRETKILRTCQNCARSFEVKRVSGARFCSTKCAKGGSRNWWYIDGRSKSPSLKQKLQWEKFPEKQKARQLVRQKVRTGKIVRRPCEVCGKENTHAHHDDYSKPLEVRWLCHFHHMKLHDSMRPPVNFVKHPIRTAEKNHHCSICDLVIAVGERYYDAHQQYKKRAHVSCVGITINELLQKGS